MDRNTFIRRIAEDATGDYRQTRGTPPSKKKKGPPPAPSDKERERIGRSALVSRRRDVADWALGAARARRSPLALFRTCAAQNVPEAVIALVTLILHDRLP